MQIRRRSPNPVVAVEQLRYQAKVIDAAPRHILEEIIWHKESEVDRFREQVSLLDLQKKVQKMPAPRDFLAALRSGRTQPAVIAEVKKASPSKGVIRENFDPVEIAQAYDRGGASCLSVLTDEKFFQGSFDNLTKVREVTDLPLLCKDFILYPYQMYLARSCGADAILLIAAILSDQDLQYFIKISQSLGLTPLIEVHTLDELDRVLALDGVTLVGMNNRNLQDFSVSLQTTCDLLLARQNLLGEKGILVVSESGLHQPSDVQQVAQAGAQAILVGESIVKQPDPGVALRQLLAD